MVGAVAAALMEQGPLLSVRNIQWMQFNSMVKTYSASQALSRVRKDQARASVPYGIEINTHGAQYRCEIHTPRKWWALKV